MKTVEEWKALLRSKLREALRARQTHSVAVLRETLAAIENAEAPPSPSPATSAGTYDDGIFAGSASGLRAGEVDRLVLSTEALSDIIEREMRERREAAEQYVALGREQEAGILTAQADLLGALIE